MFMYLIVYEPCAQWRLSVQPVNSFMCLKYVGCTYVTEYHSETATQKKKKHSPSLPSPLPLLPSPLPLFLYPLPTPPTLLFILLPSPIFHSFTLLSLLPFPVVTIPPHTLSIPLLHSTLFILGCSADSPTAAVQPHVQGSHYAGVWTDPHLPRYGQSLLLCKEC